MSNESATEFASAYERALATERARNVSSGEVQDVDVSVTDVSVHSNTDEGVLVHVEYMVGVRVEERSGAVTVSDTRYTANYYVTNETVRRAATTGIARTGPNPRTNGTTVASSRSALRLDTTYHIGPPLCPRFRR